MSRRYGAGVGTAQGGMSRKHRDILLTRHPQKKVVYADAMTENQDHVPKPMAVSSSIGHSTAAWNRF